MQGHGTTWLLLDCADPVFFEGIRFDPKMHPVPCLGFDPSWRQRVAEEYIPS